MIPLTSITGLSEYALLMSAFSLTFTGKFSLKVRILIFISVLIIAWIPVNGLIIAGYPRGVTGDLSISSVILIFCFILKELNGKIIFSVKSYFFTSIIIAVFGILYYPLSTGFTFFDPYGIAYDYRISGMFLLIIAVLAWWFNNYLTVTCICAGIFCYLLRILESDNILDYLADPVIFIFSAGYLILYLKRRKNEFHIE